jgi:hypothetical protein
MKPERLAEIQKLNQTKKYGHTNSAVEHCAELITEVERLNLEIENLLGNLASSNEAARRREAETARRCAQITTECIGVETARLRIIAEFEL